MNWCSAIGLDPDSALAELAGDAASPAQSVLRCPACGHAQPAAGSCRVCGQRLYDPVFPEVANAINAHAAVSQTGPTTEVELPAELADFGLGAVEGLRPRGRGLVGELREAAEARARAEAQRGRQW